SVRTRVVPARYPWPSRIAGTTRPSPAPDALDGGPSSRGGSARATAPRRAGPVLIIVRKPAVIQPGQQLSIGLDQQEPAMALACARDTAADRDVVVIARPHHPDRGRCGEERGRAVGPHRSSMLVVTKQSAEGTAQLGVSDRLRRAGSVTDGAGVGRKYLDRRGHRQFNRRSHGALGDEESDGDAQRSWKESLSHA